MFLSTIVFFISLLGIAGLFGVKHWERGHERILYPNLRDRADEEAAKIKLLVHMSKAELVKLPPHALIIAKSVIHAGALWIAHFARGMENRAHQLADLVSHKHRFEKRETRSEFLKQVGEHPLSNNNRAHPENNGQNGDERL
ncbi:MAG: hypothetical protein Q7S75_01635 [bacterium]|nr:hypothetical protein [bacterium]